MKEVIKTFDNGKVKEKYFVNVNGGKEGESIWYYENGNVKEKCNYHNDFRDGEFIRYYENGSVCYKCNFHNGKTEGEYVEYYEKGNVYEKCNYNADKLEGEYFIYNESNELITHRIYEYDRVIKYLLGECTNNVITLVENDVKKEDDYCLICRDEKDDKELVKLSCGHTYHKKCLVQWMKQIKKELCPMCQHEIDWSKASNLQ
jgi:hypothetical protein